MRLAAAVKKTVQDTLEWNRNPSESQWLRSQSFWSEMCDFKVVNRECRRHATKEQQARSRSRHAQELRSHLGLYYNGDPASGNLQHLCRGCCSCRREATERVTKSILQAVMPSLPPTPELGKWTKTAPCIDFFVTGVHHLFSKVLAQAAKKMKFVEEAQPGQQQQCQEQQQQ